VHLKVQKVESSNKADLLTTKKQWNFFVIEGVFYEYAQPLLKEETVEHNWDRSFVTTKNISGNMTAWQDRYFCV